MWNVIMHAKQRKSTIKDPHYASRSIRGSIMIVQRQSETKGSFPLLQILEGTQRLVDRLQQGQFTLAVRSFTCHVLVRKTHLETPSTDQQYFYSNECSI